MREEIIKEIYRSQMIEKLASRYWSYLKDNREDFVQYIYLLLCEMPEKKLVQLYNNKQLNFYLISVIRNQATCAYNPFHKLYDDPHLDYLPEDKIEYKYEDKQEL